MNPTVAGPDFSDLDDADLNASPSPAPSSFLVDTVRNARNQPQQTQCDRCRGSGQTPWGKCFRCGGSGRATARRQLLTDPTSIVRRQRGAQRRSKTQAQESAQRVAQTEEFTEKHGDVVRYLGERASRWDFARSLIGDLIRTGGLTDGQLAAARKAMQRDVERVAAREATATSVAGVGLTRLLEAFATAAAAGVKRPKVRVGDLVFSVANAHSRNVGCVYVKADGVYQGKITAEGRFYVSQEARAGIQPEVEAIARDPKAAAIAHGQRTGTCSVCGAELTNGESIARGIGPICAERFGW